MHLCQHTWTTRGRGYKTFLVDAENMLSINQSTCLSLSCAQFYNLGGLGTRGMYRFLPRTMHMATTMMIMISRATPPPDRHTNDHVRVAARSWKGNRSFVVATRNYNDHYLVSGEIFT